jgi:membrane protein implicated in regulation of membrane protease activity
LLSIYLWTFLSLKDAKISHAKMRKIKKKKRRKEHRRMKQQHIGRRVGVLGTLREDSSQLALSDEPTVHILHTSDKWNR